MKKYSEQPTKTGLSNPELVKKISEILEEELPECGTNEWFVDSVYFPTMVEKIANWVEDD